MKTRRRFIFHLDHKTVVFKNQNGLVHGSFWRWIPPQSKRSISLLGRCQLVLSWSAQGENMKGGIGLLSFFTSHVCKSLKFLPLPKKTSACYAGMHSCLVLIGCVLVAHVSNNSHQVSLKAMTRAQSPRVYTLWNRADIAKGFFDARLSCLL